MNEYIQEDEMVETRVLGRMYAWEGRGECCHSVVDRAKHMQGHAHQGLQDMGVVVVVGSAAPQQP